MNIFPTNIGRDHNVSLRQILPSGSEINITEVDETLQQLFYLSNLSEI